MNQHYVITLDRRHLRIYLEVPGEAYPRLQVVETMDLPGRGDSASPFPKPSASAAGSERVTPRREGERREAGVLAAELDAFLRDRPEASWDFAVAPGLYEAVIETLSPDTRRRLKRVISKDLVHQRIEEVRLQFAAAGR